MLIDIHTHHKNEKDHLVLIDGEHCLGIHPWELQSPFNEEEVLLKFEKFKSLSMPSLLGIGECGIDRRRKGIASIADQKKVLIWHMHWALKEKLPLIVHCVKAYSDLLQLLFETKYPGKILIHDFRGNRAEVDALLSYDIYFSFGKSLFQEDQKMANLFKQMPKKRLFLETDDQRGFSLEDIYQKSADLFEMEMGECEEIFLQNLQRFFLDVNNLGSSNIVDYLRRSSPL